MSFVLSDEMPPSLTQQYEEARRAYFRSRDKRPHAAITVRLRDKMQNLMLQCLADWHATRGIGRHEGGNTSGRRSAYSGRLPGSAADASVHAIVTDPPYGIGESSTKVASRGKLAIPKDYGTFDWDKAPPQAWLIEMLQEISDWQIIFGGNYFDLPPSSCWLVWDKKNGSNDFADCELAWTNMPKAVRRIEWLWNGMIRKGSDVREHPTQKPLGVMAWAIDQLPDEVELICDPFMGSGTTGVAAVTRGLRFIGIEREPRYFETAIARISEALQRPSLLVEPPKPAKQETLEL